MNNIFLKITKISQVFTFAAVAFFVLTSSAFAEITNPVVSKDLGTDSVAAANGAIFSSYFITVWRALITIGGLTLIFNLVNGALEWISAGGEKGKVEHGRQKMTNAVIGMVILAGSFAFVSFISSLFGFNLLQLTIPTPK